MGYTPQILIIEDEPSVRRLIERVLSEDGYSVVSVATGRHALWVMRELSFDLVIADMSLPDGDGPELLRDIRAEFPHVKMVAMSGAMESHMEGLARLAGASAAFAKPIKPEDLRMTIYAALDPSCSWKGFSAS